MLADLPWRDNLEMAGLRGLVHPDHRRRGMGGRLLDEALAFAAERGRPDLHSGAFLGTDGVPSSRATDSPTPGQHVYAIRRLDLHHGGTNWDRLYDEAAAVAPTTSWSTSSAPPPTSCSTDGRPARGASTTHPPTRASEPDVWDADRVRAYDERDGAAPADDVPRAGRHVPDRRVGRDEPALRRRVRAVRRRPGGHQRGPGTPRAPARAADEGRHAALDADQRPEVAATETWNATDNHHMIAVNERLGCRVVAQQAGYRRVL